MRPEDIAIGLAAWNRPAYLHECLRSLQSQRGGCPPIFLQVDGEGGYEDDIKSIVANCYQLDITVTVERENLGVNRNTKAAIDRVWAEGYEWAIYLEDDLVLSPDAIDLACWYVDNAEDLEAHVGWIGTFCLCRMGGDDHPPESVLFSRAFSGWGFVTSEAKYRIIEPAWLSGEKDTPPSMWDRHVGRRIRDLGLHNYNCVPALSRVTNIGEFGFHFTPARHRKWMEGHQWNQSSLAFAFQAGGWTADAKRHREKLAAEQGKRSVIGCMFDRLRQSK